MEQVKTWNPPRWLTPTEFFGNPTTHAHINLGEVFLERNRNAVVLRELGCLKIKTHQPVSE